MRLISCIRLNGSKANTDLLAWNLRDSEPSTILLPLLAAHNQPHYCSSALDLSLSHFLREDPQTTPFPVGPHPDICQILPCFFSFIVLTTMCACVHACVCVFMLSSLLDSELWESKECDCWLAQLHMPSSLCSLSHVTCSMRVSWMSTWLSGEAIESPSGVGNLNKERESASLQSSVCTLSPCKPHQQMGLYKETPRVAKWGCFVSLLLLNDVPTNDFQMIVGMEE